MDIGIEDEIELPRSENSEQSKLLEQKISRLEKLVKSRDDALNELYEVEKNKNDEITSLKERIKQDGFETSKLQNIIKTLNDEIFTLNEKISDLQQQNINNLKQQQIIEASSPRIVEDLLTDKESLYKEIADLRLQISQLESNLQDKEEDYATLRTKFSEFEIKKENEIQLLLSESKDTKNLFSEKEQAQKNTYNSRINSLESEIELLKSDCLELLKLIALLQIKTTKIEIVNSESIKEASDLIVSSLSLSDKTKDLIKDEQNYNVNFSEKIISFSQVLIDRVVNFSNSSINSKEVNLEINNQTINFMQNWVINHFSGIIINRPPLCSVSHTESLYKEKEYILNCIEEEYFVVEEFLNKILIDSEDSIKESSLNIFKILLDILFLDINNSYNQPSKVGFQNKLNTIDRESKEYLKTELLFKLIIKSVAKNDSEPLITNFNEIMSEVDSDLPNPKKIELEEPNVCLKIFSIKKFIHSLLKLSFGCGWNLLHVLSYLEQIETLQLLLEQFSFEEQINIVNRKSSSGFIPISLSILKDNLLITELFLTCGSDVQTQDNRRNTLIHFAVNPDIQEILIKRRILLNVKNSSGQLANVIQSNSKNSKFHLDEFDQNESSDTEYEKPQLQTSNARSVNNYEYDFPEPSKRLSSFCCQTFDSQETENKVMLSAWISGNEPVSSCRDDFCIFSTPESENQDSDMVDHSVWNMLGFSSSRNISSMYKSKNGDHAAMGQNLDRLEEMGLTSSERKKRIWSDIVINYTARGLEKSCFPPPLDCPTNLFRQILVLTSERFALFQYSPLKLLQAAPIIDFEEIIIPKNSNVLLLLKVDGWDDILLEVNRRSEFLDELTTLYRTLTTPSEILLSQATETSTNNSENKPEKSSSFWLGFMGNKNLSSSNSDPKQDVLSPERASAFQNLISVYGENPPIVAEPDNLIGLFNSENQYSLVLAIINKSSFMLLPHRESSLLVSIPTYHFGFLGICINPPLALENPLSQKKKELSDSILSSENDSSENRLWQERFFILRSDGALIWCHHPNDNVYCETIPIRFVRQIRVFNLATSKENEFVPCFALDFTKNSVPSSLILHSDSSEMRDKWVEKIHNVRTVLSESSES
ncbi:pleckstrin domain-containing protein [Cryptosporidium ubiquitum]|uniref:Pleckstrin domain-containing protein n=1 Tax=Cryptosporidium ubiquitum TaxID=857276 RepID=A0A1J4MD01_9CRYT|nr:pleckstrin domain-containing protein [Cryptosporidium ubiquitum]OII71855.1 pleckstrin domain-containing protein [Cryptosporidium ubiquitum]